MGVPEEGGDTSPQPYLYHTRHCLHPRARVPRGGDKDAIIIEGLELCPYLPQGPPLPACYTKAACLLRSGRGALTEGEAHRAVSLSHVANFRNRSKRYPRLCLGTEVARLPLSAGRLESDPHPHRPRPWGSPRRVGTNHQSLISITRDIVSIPGHLRPGVVTRHRAIII